MRWLRVLALTGVIAGSLAGSARGADLLAHPDWSSNQIRAARSIEPEDALVFDLRSEVRSGGGAPKITSSTVTLARTFDEVDEGDRHDLDDFALCRGFEWSDSHPRLSSISCYAFPAFAVMELPNRRLLAKIIDEAAAKGAAINDKDPYWAEAELAVQDQAGERLKTQRRDAVTEYRLGDAVVVRLSGAVTSLSPEEGRWLGRYLARHAHLHPQVRRDLERSGELPARLEIEERAGGTGQTEVLVLSNPRRIKIAFPMPAGLESDLRKGPSQGDTAMARGLKQALLAIDGHTTAPRPTLDSLSAAIRGASAHHRRMEVLMELFCITQMNDVMHSGEGMKLVAELRPLMVDARTDPRVEQWLQIQDLAGNSQATGDREAAARFLAGARDMDQIPFGTFRYLTFANLVRGSAGSDKWDPAIFKAMPSLTDDYWIHIAAYPWASGAYKDLGDAYFQAFDIQNAWLAFDLGRAIDTGWRFGPMISLSNFEDQLRSAQPDFF